ncbi:demethylmenaquinone methyltransferase [Fusarium albosuccineum]|uniref:Demethylmenaquinone methyltransferase n=1 Tax=Fusarium albosuccineum TaxID=1237068 RepID=A0A8H4KJK7_9HYPO|nr:demethylmenaquinone methyltransferase [Fusarium albosuccineum]
MRLVRTSHHGATCKETLKLRVWPLTLTWPGYPFLKRVAFTSPNMSGDEGRSETNASAGEILKETDHPTKTILKETNHPNGVALIKHDQSTGAVLTGAGYPTGTVLLKTDRATDTVLAEQDAPQEADANPPPEDDGDSAFGSEPAIFQDRLEYSFVTYLVLFSHHQLNLVLGDKLHLSPLKKNIQRVLDIGTGTGIWAIDFADEFPNAEVTSTDISVIQSQWIPPSPKFEIEDRTQTWTFGDNSIDYTHMRYLIGSIKNWPSLMKEAFRVCKPGGYVESFEGSLDMESDDDTVPKRSAMADWGPIFKEAGV